MASVTWKEPKFCTGPKRRVLFSVVREHSLFTFTTVDQTDVLENEIVRVKIPFHNQELPFPVVENYRCARQCKRGSDKSF